MGSAQRRKGAKQDKIGFSTCEGGLQFASLRLWERQRFVLESSGEGRDYSGQQGTLHVLDLLV